MPHDRLPNGLTPAQDAALDKFAAAIRDYYAATDEKPACSCPTDAEIRAAIHHSHQQLTNGGTKVKYLVRINGAVWASGLTEEAAEVVVRENKELRPGLDIQVEAVAR